MFSVQAALKDNCSFALLIFQDHPKRGEEGLFLQEEHTVSFHGSVHSSWGTSSLKTGDPQTRPFGFCHGSRRVPTAPVDFAMGGCFGAICEPEV